MAPPDVGGSIVATTEGGEDEEEESWALKRIAAGFQI